MLTAVMMEFQ
ncbi:hypothetical protein LINGRAHAP2_LOCUS37911 [Linum grandiflorum]